MSYLSDKTLKSMGFRRLGEAVRISDKASIHNCELIEIGDNTRIDDFVVLSGRIEIGCNVHIAVFCNVAGGSEGVFLSDFSGRAYGCQVLSQSDDYSGRTMTNPTVPTRFKREAKRAVCVGRHCIVGACSVIFPGVNLAHGCAVGANSKVIDIIKEVQSYGVDVHVTDPTADPEEAMHEYGVTLKRFDDLPRADAMVSAVAHREYKGLSVEDLGKKMVKGGALIDVKAAFDPAAITGAGYKVWRL